MAMEPTGSNRRELILGASTLLVAAGAPARAQQHVHFEPKHPKLVEAASHCVRTGEDCLRHCFDQFAKGDSSLAECARQVRELVIACSALSALASHDSKHLASFAAAVAAVCKSCEAECRKHEHHLACKVCADSCPPCIAECDNLRA
jgi:Cys-rich four helix bundle protein (predicted Tat secretion target)